VTTETVELTPPPSIVVNSTSAPTTPVTVSPALQTAPLPTNNTWWSGLTNSILNAAHVVGDSVTSLVNNISAPTGTSESETPPPPPPPPPAFSPAPIANVTPIKQIKVKSSSPNRLAEQLAKVSDESAIMKAAKDAAQKSVTDEEANLRIAEEALATAIHDFPPDEEWNEDSDEVTAARDVVAKQTKIVEEKRRALARVEEEEAKAKEAEIRHRAQEQKRAEEAERDRLKAIADEEEVAEAEAEAQRQINLQNAASEEILGGVVPTVPPPPTNLNAIAALGTPASSIPTVPPVEAETLVVKAKKGVTKVTATIGATVGGWFSSLAAGLTNRRGAIAGDDEAKPKEDQDTHLPARSPRSSSDDED
jgi:type III secretion protein O